MAKKSKFNGLLSSQFKRPNKWRLTKSLTFKTDLWDEEIELFKKNKIDLKWDRVEKDKLTVPKGYITDMASVPRAAWAFIAPFDVARAAVCHDIMYEKLNARRKHINTKEFKLMRSIADTVFMNGMNASEPPVRSWKKFAAYWAVRMFGWSAIKSSAPRKW
tara:strand:- start:9350 stop:9832 length:483 start_codon:yes stop_codon:yes gene_type:complete